MPNAGYLPLIILLCCILPAARKRRRLMILKKQRKGEKGMLPKELMQEFIGKVCSVMVYDEIVGTDGKILAIEENWLKIQTKKETKLINGDMIKNITIMADKYQW